MKIFPSSSIKKLDAYTIEHEPIASIDLMERAATVLTKAITDRWGTETPVTIFAGPGNNGGDALAVARMMAEKGYKTEVYLFNTKGNLSPDCQTNKELVEMMEEVTFFPFGDNIERAHKSGVDYIAQAGGSVRDDHVIETCDKYGIAMSFTGIRLFHH